MQYYICKVVAPYIHLPEGVVYGIGKKLKRPVKTALFTYACGYIFCKDI